jgi:hypothetical protein
MESAPFQDAELAARLCGLPGVVLEKHYRGREQFSDRYFIHFSVRDDAALHRLCRISAGANAPLHVYEISATEIRYCLEVNASSRAVLMSWDFGEGS